MCLALRCMPADLDEMDAATYRQYREFLRVERAAGRLRAAQSALYG
jgi:hypothetical protein